MNFINLWNEIKNTLPHVDTSEWSLTDEQISIINQINVCKRRMRSSYYWIQLMVILFISLTLCMTVLQEDQAFIAVTFRLVMAFAVGFGFSKIIRLAEAHDQFVQLHAQLMNTSPPLPGAPGYVEPLPEGINDGRRTETT